MLHRIAWLAATLGIGTAAFGEDERAVEPVNVEEVLPCEAGSAEARISIGAIAAATEEGEGPALSVAPAAQLFLGLTDRLGVEVGGSISQPLAQGPSQLHLSVAARLLLLEPGGPFPGVVARLELASSSGEPTEVTGSLGFVRSLGRFTAQGSIGLSASRAGPGWATELDLSLAMRSAPRLFVFVEGAVEWEPARGEPAHASAGPAVKWMASPSMSFALGAFFGLGPGADPARISAQFQHSL